MSQLDTDLEGPITLNDNAFELASAFLPEGARAFTLLSRYDDILAEIVKRPGYRAGSTLILILPFLLAFGLDQRTLENFSKRDVKFVPDAVEVIGKIQEIMPVFIISTSYGPYVQTVAELLGLPAGACYATAVDLGRYRLNDAERRRVRGLYSELLALPLPEVPRLPTDLPPETAGAVARLDQVFHEIAALEVGQVLREVEPRGGAGKAEAVHDSLEQAGGGLEAVIYIGDSITDVAALRLVREGGGLAVAFNGNRYAIEAAEIACVSMSARPLRRIAEAFHRRGREGVLKLAREGGLEGMTIVKEGDETLIAASERMREKLRGAAGGLG